MIDTRSDARGVANYVARAFFAMVDEEIVPVMPALLRQLAEGRPVETAALADAVGRPVAELDALLERFGVERDAAGRIVGAGLTLRPTPHRFAIGGRLLYTWCALDALVFPAVLGTTAEVESLCAATGTPVRVRVGPAAVESVAPAGAAVSFLVSDDEQVAAPSATTRTSSPRRRRRRTGCPATRAGSYGRSGRPSRSAACSRRSTWGGRAAHGHLLVRGRGIGWIVLRAGSAARGGEGKAVVDASL
jgi:hypothetical protein